MFNSASRQYDAIRTASLCKIGLFLVWWALSPMALAQVEPDNGRGIFTGGSRVSERDEQSDPSAHTMTTVASLQQQHGYRGRSTTNKYLSKVRNSPSHGVGWQDHRISKQAQIHHDRSVITRNALVWQEPELDSYPTRYRISKPISLHYLALAEHVNLDAFHMSSQFRGEDGNVLANLEHCPYTMHFSKSPENRFRIETVYERAPKQRMSLGHYAKSYAGASPANHQDFAAIFPALEYIDTSVSAVYRPEGKMLSLRYENRKGSSLYSEITIFF